MPNERNQNDNFIVVKNEAGFNYLKRKIQNLKYNMLAEKKDRNEKLLIPLSYKTEDGIKEKVALVLVTEPIFIDDVWELLKSNLSE